MSRGRLLDIDHAELSKNYVKNAMGYWDDIKNTMNKAEIVFSRMCVFTAAGAQLLTHIPAAREALQHMQVGSCIFGLPEVRNAALYAALGGVAARAVITGIANHSGNKAARSFVELGVKGTEMEETVRNMGTNRAVKQIFPELYEKKRANETVAADM